MYKRIVTVLLFSLLVIPAFAAMGGHQHHRAVKKGILLVAFGSSYPEARVSFENIERAVKAAFPDVPVRWAYTSKIIRHKLAKEGRQIDSVEIALSKMMEEGFTHVGVQSLHTIMGEEYHDLVATTRAFSRMPGRMYIVLGDPLLSSQEDMAAATKAIIQNIPEKRKKSDAVVLMGHGTPHPANAFYAALMYHLQLNDPRLFVGTVEGSPDINDILKTLNEKKIKKTWLMPFMSVSGDHARNDMAGDEADAWKSILTNAGIQCEIVLKGTAEYDNMLEIWVSHLKNVMMHSKEK